MQVGSGGLGEAGALEGIESFHEADHARLQEEVDTGRLTSEGTL